MGQLKTYKRVSAAFSGQLKICKWIAGVFFGQLKICKWIAGVFSGQFSVLNLQFLPIYVTFLQVRDENNMIRDNGVVFSVFFCIICSRNRQKIFLTGKYNVSV